MDQENEFVNAADFFRQPAPGGKAAGAAPPPARPVRESLLVVARNSQVRNKISAFDRQQASGAGARTGTGAGAPHPAARRGAGGAPSLGAIAEEAALVSAPPPRRHAASVLSTATAPTARGAPAAAVPSPATKQQVAEKRQAAAFPSIMFHAPPPAAAARAPLPGSVAVLPPMPAAVQQQERRASGGLRPLPSVLAPARASRSPQQQEPAEQQAQQQAGQAPAQALHQAVAKVLAAEAAAAAPPAESDDEQFEDADSGPSQEGSGIAQEGSAVWADARDAPAQQRLLIQEDDAASVASDASTVVHEHPSADDLAAVEEQLAAEQPLQGEPPRRWSMRSEQAAEPAELPDAGAAAPFHPIHGAVLEQVPFAAAPMRRSSLSPAVSAGGRRSSFGVAVAAPAASPPAEVAPEPSLWASLRASLGGGEAPAADAPAAAAPVAAPEASPPAEVAPQPSLWASLRASLGGSEAPAAEAPVAAATPAAAVVEESGPAAESPQPQLAEPQAGEGPAPVEPPAGISAFALAAPEPAAAPPAAGDAASAPAQEASGASACCGGAAAGLPAAPETSRLSLASSSGGAAPSLRVEFSEASLRYSVDMHGTHSPARSHRSNPSHDWLHPAAVAHADGTAAEQLLPPASAATPQQPKLSVARMASPAAPANTPASPAVVRSAARRAAEERCSVPVPAAAVAQAIEQAAVHAAGPGAGEADTSPARRLSLAEELAAAAPGAEQEDETAPRRTSCISVPGQQAAEAADAGAAPSGTPERQQLAPATAAASPTVRASPAPATPYAATEYDGDDVVMADVDFTPCPTTGRRLPRGGSRFQAEALASALPQRCAPSVEPAPAAPAASPPAAQPEALAAPVLAPSPAAPAAEEAPAAAEEPAPEQAPPAEEHAAVKEPAAAPEASDSYAALPGLPAEEAAARRGRGSRLSMPAVRPAPAAPAEGGSRLNRLSLPGGLPWAMAPATDEAAFAARPKLAESPAAPARPPSNDDELQQQQQQEEQQQEEEQQQQQLQAPPAEEPPAERAASPVAEQPAAAPQPAATEETVSAPAAAEDEEALAAAAFAAKPRLSMSPVLPAGQPRSSLGGASDPEDDAASAFAARPKLSMSPAASSGGMGRTALLSPAPGAEAEHAAMPEQPAAGQQDGALQEAPLQPAWAPPALHDSPAMSDNPLAAARAGGTPAEAPARRLSRFSHSPNLSGLSAGALSNNPMFAGTPTHPTPPSVNLKSFSGRLSLGGGGAGGSGGGTPHSASSGGSTPASTGMRLAERLQQVAEQLRHPAAPQGLAALATPSGARAATAAATPTGRFDFADDVAAMLQALDARTPATAAQPGGLSRVAAALATTVRRPRAGGRLSLASGGTAGGLLDLEGFDANGEHSGAGTPLLRQQLLAGTPAASGALGAGSVPRSAGAAAATPVEVKALRDEVAALRKQLEVADAERSDMAGLLGGYQSSIRELQDQHSAQLVRMRGENATLKAEAEELRHAHTGTDSQFRSLYNDKYLPLKDEAAGLRRELGVLQKRVLAEELRAHKAAGEAAATRQELSEAGQRAERYKALAAEAAAEAAAARDAEQRLQQQLAGEQRRMEKAVAAKEGEAGELRARYAALARQYDEAVHKANLAKQARERAQLEVQRKEEEVVALEVRLKEYEGALREYKRENAKFFEAKERYKATIAGLEREVQAKESEKKDLIAMCSDLMTRLEREGLA